MNEAPPSRPLNCESINGLYYRDEWVSAASDRTVINGLQGYRHGLLGFTNMSVLLVFDELVFVAYQACFKPKEPIAIRLTRSIP